MSAMSPLSPEEAYDVRARAQAHQVRVKAWRLSELQRLLRDRPRTVNELARYFGVSERSVQRDLQTLDLAQIGLSRRDDDHTYALPPTASRLNAVEALAVHAAARLLYHHTPAHNHHYREGLVKLAAMLPEPVRSVAMRSAQHAPDRPEESHALELAARAWFERRVLRFSYRKPNQPEPERGNELHVYFIEVSRDNLAPYVIGFERARRRAVRTFKLSRMSGLTLLGDTFAEQELLDFDPKAYLSDAWGVVGGAHVGQVTVRLRFRPDAAYRVLEGGYPGMSESVIFGDGSLEVAVRVGVDGSGLPREVLSWILGWGPRVEVLGPQNVREYWLGQLRETLRLYGERP